MSVWTWCFLGIASLSGAKSFNLDVMHPVVYHSPFPSDYFGFSLGLHPGSENDPKDLPWMMVGAPRANDSLFKTDVGLVYKCLFKRPCHQLKVDYNEPLKKQPSYRKVMNNSMLGSVIDMSADQFVICSPKWKTVKTGDSDRIRMYGACYWGSSKNLETEVTELIPLATGNDAYCVKETLGKKEEKKCYYDFQLGQAGFSAHISNGTQELLLGAPSVRSWLGSTVTYKIGRDARGTSQGKISSNPINIFEQCEISSPNNQLSKKKSGLVLQGYSVTSGRYFTITELISVAGAPTSYIHGQVYAYTLGKSTKGKSCFQWKAILNGKQTGEYFGASLASGDIDGDGLDDLIVGAPLYTNEKSGFASQNEGRVFVYLGRSLQTFEKPTINHEIDGKDYNGRFGTTIMCVGDLDLDGLADFAIAAPYTGSGIVFIYRGSFKGLVLSQKIVGSELMPKVAGFGFAISRGQDMDKNGYNDIAIGAYKSGHAIIIRSKPVIELTPNITLQNEKLYIGSKKLDSKICVGFNGVHTPNQIKVVMNMTMDQSYNRIFRANSSSTQSHEILEVPKSGLCFKISFDLSKNTKNFQSHILISAEFSVAPENVTKVHPILKVGSKESSAQDTFCSSCPVSRAKIYVQSAEIGFFLGCENQNHCVPNLTIVMAFVDTAGQKLSQFVRGSADSINLKVTLNNTGDPSFNTKLRISLPSIQVSMPPGCNNVTNGTAQVHLECDAGNPLKKNSTRDIFFLIDTESLLKDASNLQVHAEVMSENSSSASASLDLPFVSQADVTIYGIRQQDNYMFTIEKGKKRKKEESKVAVTALYQFAKSGVSPLQVVVLKVDVPVALASNETFLQFSKPKIYMNNVETLAVVCDLNDYQLSKEAEKTTDQTSGMTDDMPDDSSDMDKKNGVRAKREVTHQEDSKYPASSTLFINCTSGEWNCTKIICRTELLFSHHVATLELEMYLNMSVLGGKLGQKDIVILGTKAHIEIEDPSNVEQPLIRSPHEAQVSIVLRRHFPADKIKSWVVALAINIGIVLLALLVAGLFKAGFFKRKVRDELLIKKRQTNMTMTSERISQGEMASDVFEDEAEPQYLQLTN